MTGYRNPGRTQSTNIKNKSNIRECLDTGKRVEIYILPDNGLFRYGEFNVNLAAGLGGQCYPRIKPTLERRAERSDKPDPPANRARLIGLHS